MMIANIRWVVPFFCLLSVACAGNVDREPLAISLVQVAAGQHAMNPGEGFEAEWISEQGRLTSVWKGLGRKFINSSNLSMPDVDFSKERMLYLSMGQKTTAGYSIGLDSEHLTLSDRIAIVRVLWQEPEPGSIQAQVITAPYLLLRFPNLDVEGIRVIDQNNRVHAEILFPR